MAASLALIGGPMWGADGNIVMAQPAPPASMLGIVCAIGAAISFSLNDLGIKALSGDYPLHQVVLVRASIGLLFTMALFMPLEGGYHNLKTNRLRLHLLRGLFVVFANLMFFLGLAAISLPEATAIFFVSPMIITLFSVIFLGETVGPQRWAAVAIGLVGTLIMLRPTPEAFQWAALFPLCAAVGYAALHTLTRRMGVTEKASTMAFYIQFVFVIVSACMGLAFGDGRLSGSDDPSWEFLFRPWVWPQSNDLMIMVGVGIASATGGYLISQAYRVAAAAVIAPFEYIALVLAIFWGITLFNEFPDQVAWMGIALILFGGLFLIWREAIKNRTQLGRRRLFRFR